jgi:hypothetical protein
MVSKFMDGSFYHVWIVLDAGWTRSSDEPVFVNITGSCDPYIEKGAIPIMTVQVLCSINIVWVVSYRGGLDCRWVDLNG